MNLDEFIAKYNGQTIGYNGYTGECLSLVKRYIKDFFSIDPPSSGVNAAYGYWTNFPQPLPQVFDKVSTPSRGDIVIWGTGVGKSGHIAIYLYGYGNSFYSFDQNWPVGSECHIQEHNYNNILGYLHPKGGYVGKILWDSNVEVIFTSGQTKRLFELIADREPENTQVTEGQSWGVVEALAIEHDRNKASVQKQINDLTIALETCNNKPPVIQEKIVYKEKELTEEDKKKIADEYNIAHPVENPSEPIAKPSNGIWEWIKQVLHIK